MDEGSEKGKKRPRSESPESDLARADSDLGSPEPQRPRVDTELDSPDVKKIQDDLLNILDDSEAVADRDPAIQGLDSVIKSFEEEILVPDQAPAVLDLASELPEAQTELGYLLEASDDELGLPPSFGSSEDELKSETAEPAAASSAGAFGFTDPLTFDNELPNYDSFEIGMCGGDDTSSHNYENGSQFVTLGGLFDYTDDVEGDATEYLWRPESLPAI